MAASDHHDDHDAHEAHGHDDFDPEPARELSPGEPRTPNWVPLLGAVLFLVGGVYFFASGAEADAQTAGSASASASAAPVRAARSTPTDRGRAAPSAAPVRTAPPQDAAARKRIVDQLKTQMKEKSDQPPAPQPPRAP